MTPERRVLALSELRNRAWKSLPGAALYGQVEIIDHALDKAWEDLRRTRAESIVGATIQEVLARARVEQELEKLQSS